MVQRLETLVALPEDLGLIPSAHMAAHHWSVIANSRGEVPTPPQTYRQKYQCT